MGKKSTLIALIAIIFGAGGIGFGAFTMVNFQAQLNAISNRSGVVHSWYDETPIQYDANSTYVPIPYLSVDIVVNAGEHVYISYMAYAILESAQAEFKICINNRAEEYTEVTSFLIGTINMCVTMQCVNNSIDPGTYTVTVWAIKEMGTSCRINRNSLFAQTFIP